MNSLNLKSLDHPPPGLKKSFFDFFGLGFVAAFFVTVLVMLGFFLVVVFPDLEDGDDALFAFLDFANIFAFEEDFFVDFVGFDLELVLDLDFEETVEVGFGRDLGGNPGFRRKSLNVCDVFSMARLSPISVHLEASGS